MKNKITYRKATSADYSSILTLYNSVYNSGRTVENLKWLYEQNPMGSGVLFVAECDGLVIGMQSAIPYTFTNNGKKISTYKSEDTLVHENYRGMGVLRNLYALMFDLVDYKLLWGFTDKKKIFEKIGRKYDFRFSTMTLRYGLFLPQYFDNNERYKILKSFLINIKSIKQKLDNKFSQKYNYNVYEVESIENNRLQKFFIEVQKDNPDIYFPVITNDYLIWRLTDNPHIADYSLIISEDSLGKLCGFAILSIRDQIAELLTVYHTGYFESNQFVLEVSKIIFRKKTKLVTFWASENNSFATNVSKNLNAAGFRNLKKGLWIGNNDKECEIQSSNLYFSKLLSLQ